MKSLKLMLAGLAVLFTGLAANANVRLHKAPLSQDDVVNMYVSVINTGASADLDKILTDDAMFNSIRGENVHTLNKDEFVNYIKSNSGNTTQANSVTKTVLASDDNSAKIQVDFKYDGYTRTDIVTLAKTNSWEITSIDSSVK